MLKPTVIGFTDGVTGCEDVNECTTKKHDCHTETDCVNTEGSYVCLCKSGYIEESEFCQGSFFPTSAGCEINIRYTCVNSFQFDFTLKSIEKIIRKGICMSIKTLN